MTQPKRIQRKRTKGWKMPEGCFYVGRPSKWGSRFIVVQNLEEWWVQDSAGPPEPSDYWWDTPFAEVAARFKTKKEAAAYAVYLYAWDLDELQNMRAAARRELKGKSLCCWCPLETEDGQPYPCHADELLRIANTGE